MHIPLTKTSIRLRPGGVMYLVITAFIGLAAAHSQVNLLFGVFGLLVAGAGVSLFVGPMMLRGIRVCRHGPSEPRVGRRARFEYELTRSRAWMPAVGLTVVEADLAGAAGPPMAWVPSLLGGTVSRAAAGWVPEHRGRHRLRRIGVSTRMPIGVFEFTRWLGASGELVVLPRVDRLRPTALTRPKWQTAEGLDPSEREGGREEFYGVREYVDGDSFKLIDWRLSARTGQWVTREMTRPDPPRLMVGLDLRGVAKPEAEAAISLAASWLVAAASAGNRVGLAAVGLTAEKPGGHPKRHLGSLLHVLALCNQDSGGAIEPADGGASASWVVIGPAASSLGPAGALRVPLGEMAQWIVEGQGPDPVDRSAAGVAA